AFVLTSFLMVVGLGWVYSIYGGLGWMQAAFCGVGRPVIGSRAHGAYARTRRSVGTEWLLWRFDASSCVAGSLAATEDVGVFLAAVAVAMITPGPVVITVGFIGFLIAGFAGASVAALGTFLPCYLFTIIPAPYFKKYGKRPGIVAFVDGVTAAAIGAITGAVVVLGRRPVFDLPTVLLAITPLASPSRFHLLAEPPLVRAARTRRQ